MPYFHVTFARHIDSIQKHGLGGRIVMKNWDCEDGVYLSTDPVYGIAMLLEHYIDNGDPDSVPRDYLGELRIIVIDDSRVDRRLLTDDISFEGKDHIRRYKGVIDVSAMPVLHLEQVLPQMEHEIGLTF